MGGKPIRCHRCNELRQSVIYHRFLLEAWIEKRPRSQKACFILLIAHLNKGLGRTVSFQDRVEEKITSPSCWGT